MLQPNTADKGRIQITYCPLDGDPDKIDSNCQRLLVAAGGTWIEVENNWLHARAKLCDCPGTENYFGRVENLIHLKCGQIPGELLGRMVNEAAFDFPRRYTARIFWNEVTGKFRYISGDGEPFHGDTLILKARSLCHESTIFQSRPQQSTTPIISCVIGNLNTGFPYTHCMLHLDGVDINLDPFEPVLQLYDTAG